MKNGIVRFQLLHSVPLHLCPFAPLHQPSKHLKTPGTKLYEFLRTNLSAFYAKQSQSQVRQNQHKHFYNNEIRLDEQLVIQTKQTQFKANKAKNKANSNPIKAKTNPIQSQFLYHWQRLLFIITA